MTALARNCATVSHIVCFAHAKRAGRVWPFGGVCSTIPEAATAAVRTREMLLLKLCCRVFVLLSQAAGAHAVDLSRTVVQLPARPRALVGLSRLQGAALCQIYALMQHRMTVTASQASQGSYRHVAPRTGALQEATASFQSLGRLLAVDTRRPCLSPWHRGRRSPRCGCTVTISRLVSPSCEHARTPRVSTLTSRSRSWCRTLSRLSEAHIDAPGSPTGDTGPLLTGSSSGPPCLFALHEDAARRHDAAWRRSKPIKHPVHAQASRCGGSAVAGSARWTTPAAATQ